MSESLLPFLDPATPAAPLPERAGLAKPAIDRLEDDMTVEAYLAALREAGEVIDAIRVLADALPAAVAVDWARGIVLEAYPEGSSRHAADLMATVDAWMEDPEDDDRRRRAMNAAAGAQYEGPEAWVAAAVGWSGGSMAPPHVDPVPPPPGLAGRAAAGAIVMTVVRDPMRIVPEAEAALERGLALAAEVPPPAEPPPPSPAESPDAVRTLQRPVGEPAPAAGAEERPDGSSTPGGGLRVRSLRRPRDPGPGQERG